MRKFGEGFWTIWTLIVVVAICAGAAPAFSQQPAPPATALPATQATNEDVQSLAQLVRQLQGQLQGLNAEIGQLRTEQQTTRTEMAALRKQLDVASGQSVYRQANAIETAAIPETASARAASSSSLVNSASAANAAIEANDVVASSSQPGGDDRLDALEENLELTNQKIAEQSQTKVESGSKYRLRLSGILLLNLFSNQGGVENQELPEFATGHELGESNSTFGGSLRQSEISLQTFGPDIAGAHTSADLRFDFAGGTPSTANGTAMGIVRLRTATARFDWTNTSIVAGQDRMFFLPVGPTSVVSLASPALSYSGNLWAWSPQVRVEHRVALSEHSNITVQAGILDSVSGEDAEPSFDREPSRGEQSGQPAYAARLALSERVFGQQLIAGLGGYYGRQNWEGRTIGGWIGSADLTLPLGNRFEFSGDFYRGRAVGGFGGAIGQTIFFKNGLNNAALSPAGLDSMGGWIQLKYKATNKFQVDAALGDDNPFASELRLTRANNIPSSEFVPSRNLSPFFNFIYQPRSAIVFSGEYRYLKTSGLDSHIPNTANLLNFAIGYIF